MPSGIELGPGGWLLLAGAAGFAGLDATGWPQAMWSRPLVAATAGGAVLELLVLRHVPLGGARCPDTGPASVVAGAALAAGPGPEPGAVAVAAITGWALGWLGEGSVSLLRRVAGRALRDTERLARWPARLERRHRALLALDFARGALLAVLFLVPAAGAVTATDPLPAGAGSAALGIGLGAAAGAGARELSAGVRGSWLLGAGAAAGLLLGGIAA